jgi:chaperonin GroES
VVSVNCSTVTSGDMSSVIGRDASVSPVAVEDPSPEQPDTSTAGEDAGEEFGEGSREEIAPSSTRTDGDKLAIKMLNDRILVQLEGADGERKSSGGILIPATAQVGKRLAWAQVVAKGPSVRTMELNDRVLFNPEDRYEVEVGGRDYIILRERDIHAVAAERLDASHTGLYL